MSKLEIEKKTTNSISNLPEDVDLSRRNLESKKQKCEHLKSKLNSVNTDKNERQMIKSNLAKSKKQLEDAENDAAEQIKALTEIARDQIEFETKIYETELQKAKENIQNEQISHQEKINYLNYDIAELQDLLADWINKFEEHTDEIQKNIDNKILKLQSDEQTFIDDQMRLMDYKKVISDDASERQRLVRETFFKIASKRASNLLHKNIKLYMIIKKLGRYGKQKKKSTKKSKR